tara:strand:+ start:114 stop:944 length:831 start_codon:yes stop_codon:yes gene_type:complete
MNYKLIFTKISPSNPIAGVGFAGNIFMVLSSLTCLESQDKLIVDMETNECICSEPNTLLHNTKNSWEYYFDQYQPHPEELCVSKTIFELRGSLTYDNNYSFKNPAKYVHLKETFYRLFSIKPLLNQIINEYYTNNMKDKITLGVQVRLSDMQYLQDIAGIEKYVEKIKTILKNNTKIEQLFIATDDSDAINTVSESVSIPVIYHKDMYRTNKQKPDLDPYDRLYAERELHRYKLGEECMKEIFCLTKCDYFLMADKSSISIVATMLSENIKEVYII